MLTVSDDTSPAGCRSSYYGCVAAGWIREAQYRSAWEHKTDTDTARTQACEALREQHSVSSELKHIGFRYGASLHRASATFTRDDLKAALFLELPVPESPQGFEDSTVTFTVDVTGEQISLHVTSVSSCAYIESATLAEYLFPGLRYPGNSSCFIVRGVLLEPDDHEMAEPMVMARLGCRHRVEDDRTVQLIPDDEKLLTVIAIVIFGKLGNLLGAILQKVPSSADQMLIVPPHLPKL